MKELLFSHFFLLKLSPYFVDVKEQLFVGKWIFNNVFPLDQVLSILMLSTVKNGDKQRNKQTGPPFTSCLPYSTEIHPIKIAIDFYH